MIIGIPREVKTDEHRISLTPDKVDLLVKEGHAVLVEAGAGRGAYFEDSEYETAGARMVSGPSEVFDEADMIVKVKEPQPQEYELFHGNQILFTYLHLAAEPELARILLSARVTGIGYETVQEDDGRLQLLYPMSEIAGLLAPQIASYLLWTTSGGPGKLLSGVPGTEPLHVAIVGGGTVGINAALKASALGARVTILDINLDRLRYIGQTRNGTIQTIVATPSNVADVLSQADVVIGAVLVPGAAAPKVIDSTALQGLQDGALVMDVAIDQGGCVEGIRTTSHSEPTYAVDGVSYYAVPNIPGTVANTSSISLSNATYPYVLKLATSGIDDEVRFGGPISRGVNTLRGCVTHRAVAESLDLEYVPVEQALTA